MPRKIWPTGSLGERYGTLGMRIPTIGVTVATRWRSTSQADVTGDQSGATEKDR